MIVRVDDVSVSFHIPFESNENDAAISERERIQRAARVAHV